MKPARVVVIGGANLDISGHAAESARPGDSTPGRVLSSPGGVGRNIAENLARLGHRVRLVSAVGDDAAGRALLLATRLGGVDTAGCRRIAGAATASYLSLHGPDGRLLQAVNDMAVLDALTPALFAAEGLRLRRADTIVVDANLAEATLAALFALRPAAPVHADAVSGAKCQRLGPWLDRLHTLKLNRTEAELLCGLPSRTPRQRQRIADWFHHRGVQRLALSLGPQGLQLSTAEALCVLPAWNVPPVDVTGAGDALMAGLVHADLAPWPLERAADFALGCAALTVSVAPSNHPGLNERAVRSLRRSLTEKSR